MKVASWLALLLVAGCMGPAEDHDAKDPSRAPYVADQLLVRVAPGVDADALAARHGLRVLAAPDASGWCAMGGSDAHLADLTTDPDVASAAPMGRVVGTSDGRSRGRGGHGDDHHDDDDHHGGGDDRDDDGDGHGCDRDGDDDHGHTPAPEQWHLEAAGVPASGPHDFDGIVVAVLGSGVAYRNHSEGGLRFKRARSLSGVDIVDGWDFVDGDDGPDDHNGHGTHVATSIAGNAWKIRGVAPGVSLMPVRVLDADNVGTELALVQGIHFAVDHGADVINMSLAFPDGYLPSPALRDALFDAWRAGVVLVGASGNEGMASVDWPAHSPFVIAAGASRPISDDLVTASYSNVSSKLDLLSPGGDLTRDDDGDGYLDGILAESFDPADPSDLGEWLYAGTSQGAALTSGAVVHALAAGADPQRLPFALQAGGRVGALIADGTHLLDVDGARLAVTSGTSFPEAVGYHVAALAYLQREADGRVTPKAQLTVLDRTGAPVTAGVHVAGTVLGSGGARFSCDPSGPCGQCTAIGPTVDPSDGAGGERPLAFAFVVDAVEVGGFRVRPRGAFFYSDLLNGITAGLRDDAQLADAALAFRWTEGADVLLGDLAGSFSVTDAPSGGTTLPVSVTFNNAAIQGIANLSTVPVDMGASGVLAIPIGSIVDIPLIEFDPTGLSSPAFATKLAALDGSGLANLGFTASDFLAPQTSAARCSATPVLLAESAGLGTWPDASTAVGEVLATDAWDNDAGYPSASAVAASLDLAPVSLGAAGAGVGHQTP